MNAPRFAGASGDIPALVESFRQRQSEARKLGITRASLIEKCKRYGVALGGRVR